MAIQDTVLQQIVDALQAPAERAGMKRTRGGLARSVAWAEISGRRATDGAWLELRVRHRPSEQCLEASLLGYQALTRGGRTVALGEIRRTYTVDASGATRDVADAIAGWLSRVAQQGAIR